LRVDGLARSIPSPPGQQRSTKPPTPSRTPIPGFIVVKGKPRELRGPRPGGTRVLGAESRRPNRPRVVSAMRRASRRAAGARAWAARITSMRRRRRPASVLASHPRSHLSADDGPTGQVYTSRCSCIPHPPTRPVGQESSREGLPREDATPCWSPMSPLLLEVVGGGRSRAAPGRGHRAGAGERHRSDPAVLRAGLLEGQQPVARRAG
jgi:hypothetical protein